MLSRKLLTQVDTLFFLHIPKTAGTTLIAMLDSHYLPQQICPVHWPYADFKELPDADVLSYRFLRGHYNYEAIQRMHDPVYTITFLRDPVQRAISQYKQYQRVPDTYFYQQANEMSLYDYVQHDTYRRSVINISVNMLSNDTGDLELAKQNLSQMTFVGLTERFDESMALLSYLFYFPPMHEYQKRNVSPQSAADEFDKATYDLLMELSADEYELYNYGLALFNDQYFTFLSDVVDQDYRQNTFALRHPEPQSAVEFDFSTDVLPGQGWHFIEENPKVGRFRWSGPTKLSYLDFNLRAGPAYELAFKIINFASQAVLDGVWVTVGGYVIELEREHLQYEQYHFKGTIPAEAITPGGGLTRVTFQFEKLESIGPRLIGLCFNYLTIKPLT